MNVKGRVPKLFMLCLFVWLVKKGFLKVFMKDILFIKLFMKSFNTSLLLTSYVMNGVKGLVQDPKESSTPGHETMVHPNF